MTEPSSSSPEPAPPSGPRGGLILFLVLTFGWSWAIGAVIWQTGALQRPALFQGLAFLYMFGPTIGALAAVWRYDRGRRIAALGLRPRFNLWLVWAWAIPLALIAMATLIDIAGPQVGLAAPAEKLAEIMRAQGADPAEIPVSLNVLVIVQILTILFVAPAINTVGTLTEELGWRGWLWDRWRRVGFWKCNLAIGALWGVWHAPLIVQGYNYPGMPVLGPVFMTAFCVLIAPLIGLVRERGGSLWHAGLFHGTINAVTGAAMIFFTTGPAFPWQGLLGIGGAAAGLAGWALVWLYLRNRAAKGVAG